MKSLAISAFSVSFLFISSITYAQAELEITWENPKKFTDVRAANESRSKFRERTLEQLEEYITELAEKLPKGQTLVMNVTNVDLAGEVLPSSFVGLGDSLNDIRVIKTLYIPRMSFSYKLLGNDGAVLQEKDVDLKDMSFLDHVNRLSSSESLRYEKNMISEWFKDEFPTITAIN